MVGGVCGWGGGERFATPFEKYLAFLTSAEGVDLCASGKLFLDEFATG